MEFTLDSTFPASAVTTVTESAKEHNFLKFRFVFWGYSSPWFVGFRKLTLFEGDSDRISMKHRGGWDVGCKNVKCSTPRKVIEVMTGHDAERIMQWTHIFVEYSYSTDTRPKCTFCSRGEGLTSVGLLAVCGDVAHLEDTQATTAFSLGRGAWPMPMIRALFLGDESVFDPDRVKRLRLLYTITLVHGRDMAVAGDSAAAKLVEFLKTISAGTRGMIAVALVLKVLH